MLLFMCARTPPCVQAIWGFPTKGKGHLLCTLHSALIGIKNVLECSRNPGSTQMPQSTLKAGSAGTSSASCHTPADPPPPAVLLWIGVAKGPIGRDWPAATNALMVTT